MKGLVTDANNVPVANASVRVEGNDKKISTTDRGEYWRLLTPGAYRVKATFDLVSVLSDWHPIGI
jgi:carboxypeptidase D